MKYREEAGGEGRIFVTSFRSNDSFTLPLLWKYEILGRRLARQKQPNRKREVFLPSPSPSPVEQKGYKLKINGGTLSARAFVPKWPFRKVDRSLYTTGAGGTVLEKKMGIKKRPDFLSDFLSNFGTVVRSSRKDIIDKPVASWSGGLAKVLGNKVGEKGSLWSRTFSRTESISRDDLLPRVRRRTVNQREKEESFAPRLNNTLISLRVEVLDPTFSLISIHGEFKNISLTLLPRTDNVSADKAYIAFLRRETKVGTIKNIDWKLFFHIKY